jgi:hypothetical protein
VPTYGTKASSTSLHIDFDIGSEVDPSRFTRLASLLFTPSTVLGSTMAVSS